MSIAIVNKASNEEKMKKEKNNWEKQKENHEKINERKQRVDEIITEISPKNKMKTK